MNSKLCYNLLEIIEKQDDIVRKQKHTIYELVNENVEKENMINVLMRQEEYIY